MFSKILFTLIGAYFLIINAILGLGMSKGRIRRFADKVGNAPARVFYAVVGAALMAYGIIFLISPNLLS